MKRKFETLSWSELNWMRPFKIDDVKSMLGQLVGLTRRKAVIFEIRLSKNRVHYLLGTEETRQATYQPTNSIAPSYSVFKSSKTRKTFGCTVSEHQRISLCFKNGLCRKHDTFKPCNFKNTSARRNSSCSVGYWCRLTDLALNQKICPNLSAMVRITDSLY